MIRVGCWGWISVLAIWLLPRPADACTPLGGQPASRAPTEGAAFPKDAAFFTSRVRESQLRTSSGDVIALERVRRFTSLQLNGGAGVDLLRPSSPLVVGEQYGLELKDAWVVNFHVVEALPTQDVALTLHLEELLTDEPQTLSSSACYGGPLAERPFSRTAKLVLETDADVPLIVAVTTHDAVSDSDVEETTGPTDARHSDDEGLSLHMPLPDGVDPCLHIEIIDYAGQSLFDEQGICVDSAPRTIDITAKAYNPALLPTGEALDDEPEPVSNDATPDPIGEPTKASRSSQSCAFSDSGSSASNAAWLAALALFGIARRRSARERVAVAHGADAE